jgi:hypothetical protein
MKQDKDAERFALFEEAQKLGVVELDALHIRPDLNLAEA